MIYHTFTTEEGVNTTAQESSSGSQSIVDSKYSNIWKQYDFLIIADHVNQDFALLSKSNVGSRGTFDGQPIVCTHKEFGYNYLNSWLQHEDGSKYVALKDGNSILTYTCSGNGDYRVWLLEWRIEKDMTELEVRNKIVQKAISYLGYNKADGSFKPIIDAYNAYKPLARGYKVQYTDAWCATFVSAMAIMCGYTKIMPTECSCEQMINLYKNLGRWVEDESIVPQTGDIIFYDWEDSGIGDDRGVADHVGIVVSVANNTIKVIEGNTSGGKVAYRSIAVNAKYLRGYAKPDYASLATPIDIGDVSDWAKESCQKAVKLGYVKGYGDGNYGWKDNVTMERLVVFMDNLGLIK